MEETTKPKKLRKLRRNVAKELRDLAMAEMRMNGVPNKEIANKFKVNKDTVADGIHNVVQKRELIKKAESRVYSLIDKALDTIENALTSRNVDMTNGLKAALAIAKTFGVITDKINLSHSFPKPTIIEKRNGDQVILGAAYDDDESAA